MHQEWGVAEVGRIKWNGKNKISRKKEENSKTTDYI